MLEALLWEPKKELRVKCHLCHHRCLITEGKRGICQVRENRSGRLFSLVYGKVIARHVDPIEKKPLFHFYPGSLSYSIATVGCNFKCRFCQNADIAQMPNDYDGKIIGKEGSPESIVEDALRKTCKSIAYTYTEPTIYFEFAYDTAKSAHAAGLKNVFVSNGYMTQEAVALISPYLDAANIDLKAFTDDFYKIYCQAKLERVKETLRALKSAGVFLEITTLIIPGLNDEPEELRALARFLVSDLGPETPWHISRFHPTYCMLDKTVTPVKTLATAREIGLEAGLRYVYTGNVPGESGESTYCYNCGNLLIARWGFTIQDNLIKKSHCKYCDVLIDGVGL